MTGDHRMTSFKKRICLIYTGGTIGMVQQSGEQEVLKPREHFDPDDFMNPFRPEINEIAKTEFVFLFDKDSANVVPKHWTRMANEIYKRMNDFDGFVVVHGTDTMHFSASALAFAFGRNLNFPIVLTGAQAPENVPYGDAKVNLLRAVKVATEDLAEVVVAFGDYIFRGSRVQKKHESRFNAFESPAERPLGYITNEILIPKEDLKVRTRKRNPQKLDFRPGFADGIVEITLIPGLQPEILMPLLESEGLRGVILQSFGVSNVPNEGKFSFAKFIHHAVEKKKIPVILTSQLPASQTRESHYKPGADAVKAGAIPAGNMTSAAATVKFLWVLYQVAHEIKNDELQENRKLARITEMMKKSFVGELTQSESH
jgi:L-asparaginase